MMNVATAQRPAAEEEMETAPTPVRLPEIFGGKDSLAIGLTRAEVDQQIATAKQYPRSIQKAIQNIQTLATLDEETAEECMYALPRGGKPIKGPSARFAEIVKQSWGNCRVAARVVHVGDTFVEAEGIFHDLETNAATSAKVRRRILDKNGRRFSEDMIIVTGNAACSIASRNAVLGGIPKAIWRRPYEDVQNVISGDVATLAVTREKSLKAFAHYGVTPAQVFTAIDVKGEADITLEHIPLLRGMFAALKNGEATVEEMFPATKPEGKPSGAEPKDVKGRLDALAGAAPSPKPATVAEAPSVAPASDLPGSDNAGSAGDPAGTTPPTVLPDALESPHQFAAFVAAKFTAANTQDDLNNAWATYVEVVADEMAKANGETNAALAALQEAFAKREKEIGA